MERTAIVIVLLEVISEDDDDDDDDDEEVFGLAYLWLSVSRFNLSIV